MPADAVVRGRLPPRSYQLVTLAALAALAFIIVSGGAVRLTGSGLGCPDWPTCAKGHVVAPLGYHPMIEFVNRVVTGLVSVAVILAALGAHLRSPRRRDLTLLAWGLVAGLVAQIVLGGETVRHRLNPAFVQAHFLLSILVVWDAVVLHHRAGLADGVPRQPLLGRPLLGLSRLIVVLAGLTVVAGTVVTGSGPHGGDDKVRRWQLNLHRVTQIHGSAGVILLATAGATFWLLRRQGVTGLAEHRLRQLLEAVAVQIAIGYTQYFLGVPVLLVGFHLFGAVLVWTAALRFALAASSGATPGPDRPVPAGPAATSAGGRAGPRVVPVA